MFIVSVVLLGEPVAMSVICELYIPADALPETIVKVIGLPYSLAVKFPDGLMVRLQEVAVLPEKPQFSVGVTLTASLEERVKVMLALRVSSCATNGGACLALSRMEVVAEKPNID